MELLQHKQVFSCGMQNAPTKLDMYGWVNILAPFHRAYPQAVEKNSLDDHGSF